MPPLESLEELGVMIDVSLKLSLFAFASTASEVEIEQMFENIRGTTGETKGVTALTTDMIDRLEQATQDTRIAILNK